MIKRSLLPCIAIVFASSLAQAQTPTAPATTTKEPYPVCAKEPTKSESEAARGAYVAGKASFDEGDYPTAIHFFRDSYRRDCTKHALLDIIARAHELNGDLPSAIEALETYVKRVPATEPDLDVIQKRLTNLRSRVAATTQAVTSDPSRGAATTKKPEEPPSTRTASKSPNLGPWIVVGGGGAALVTGGVLLGLGLSKLGDVHDKCPNTTSSGARICPLPDYTPANADSDQSSGNTFVTVGIITASVGALAVAGGLYWYFSDRSKPSATPALQMTPVVGRDFRGLSLAGAF